MKIKEPRDELDLNSTDVSVKTGSGLLGGIPFLGPLMANMFEVAIPNTRMERFADVIRRVQSRVEDLEEFQERVQSPEGMDFVEEVITQTHTAMTEERREYIGNLFRNSITRENLDHIQKKYLFGLLSELNDVEILYLKRYTIVQTLGPIKDPFLLKHKDLFQPRRSTANASPEDLQDKAFEESYINHLQRLRLVDTGPEGVPMKTTHTTKLGDLLLEFIEVPDE